MVERPELAAAWRLLEQLDASLLRDCDCWFGGGTAISLRCGEFRLSRDVEERRSRLPPEEDDD